MTSNSWTGVDTKEAENEVRFLRSAISDTESEIDAYRELGKIDKLSFGLALGLDSLQQRRSKLELELQNLLAFREKEIISLSLDGPDFPEHSASFDSLSAILRSTQGLFKSVVQAITTGPTSRGPVPAHVNALSTLRLVSTFPSSFGLSVEAKTNRDAKNQATLERSLGNLFSLLSNADDADQLLLNASELGPRVMGHLQSLVFRLHRTKTTTSLKWDDSTGASHSWSADQQRISTIAIGLSGIREPQIVTKELSGILLGLSLLKGTFEILSDRGELIEGTIAEEILDLARLSFGTRKKFIYRETSTQNQLTGISRTASVLVKILDPDETLGLEGLAPF